MSLNPFPPALWRRLCATHQSLEINHVNGTLWCKLTYQRGRVVRWGIQAGEDSDGASAIDGALLLGTSS